MNKHLLYHGAFAAVCACAMAPASTTARAADIAPPTAASQLSINLARGDVGTRLEARAPKVKNPEKSSPEENESAQALISADPALTYPLQTGKTSLILSLSRIQVLNRFNFVSFNAAGTYSLSVSSTKLGFDAPGWRTLASGEHFDSNQIVVTDLGSVEAHYVKIDIDTERPGRISGMGLFGAPKISYFEAKPLGYTFAGDAPDLPDVSFSEPRNVFFDLASLDVGARVVALSRGGDLDGAQEIISGNLDNHFAFEATDPAPAVVVDLGARRRINRLSCVYVAPPGRLDFYLVDNPYRKDEKTSYVNYVDSPSAQPVGYTSGEYNGRSGPGGRQAIYSVDTSAQPGLNRLAADMPGQTGRFLVAEFHPLATAAPAGDFKDRDFKDTADYKDRDFKDQPATAAAGTAQPLRILSLSAFGQAPNGGVIPQVPPVTNTPGSPGGPPPPIVPPPGGFMTP
jgi:hypothetical protein